MSWIIGLVHPQWMTYDNNNHCIYISNRSNGTISKIDIHTESIEHEWITGLTSPYGLAMHDNYLYIADMNTSRIIQINTMMGIVENEQWAFIAPYYPYHISIIDNTMYISCPSSNTISRIQIDNTNCATAVEKEWISKKAGLKTPNGLVNDKNGFLYVSNTENNVISKVNIETCDIEVSWFSSNLVCSPCGMCIIDDIIYIVNENFGTICQVNIKNKIVINPEWSPNMVKPLSIIFDSDNNIYVSSRGEVSIYRYSIGISDNSICDYKETTKDTIQDNTTNNQSQEPEKELKSIQYQIENIHKEMTNESSKNTTDNPNPTEVSITFSKLESIQRTLTMIYEKLNDLNMNPQTLSSKDNNTDIAIAIQKVKKEDTATTEGLSTPTQTSQPFITIKRNFIYRPPVVDLQLHGYYPNKKRFVNKLIKLTYKIKKLPDELL
jgi:hypothetical protein